MRPKANVSGANAAAAAAGADALAGLDAKAAAALVTAVADVALVVDNKGVIRKVALGDADTEIAAADEWVGRPWVETVTNETKGKVEAVLRDASQQGVSRRRQVNHLSAGGADIPVAYTAVRVGTEGLIVAVGRDLRAMSVLQQRLVETQQAMERDYWRLRHVETRYRLLFQLSTEAVLVVDAGSRRVVDANSAAGQLFGAPADKLHGRLFPFATGAHDAQTLTDLLATTRASGRAGDVTVRLTGHDAPVQVSASCFRQDSSTLFLVRFVPTASAAAAPTDLASPNAATVLELLTQLPDGFVVTDLAGNVLSANQSFLDIAQLVSAEHARGRSLGDWIGRPGADLAVFLTVLKKHGTVRLMSTSARGEHGATTEVEVSAVMVPDGEEPSVGFMVRDVARRVASGPQGARDLTRAVEQLTELVGRVSLPELLRDTVDLVERHFIEAALELTNDNRTAAAEVLGLSRQSVYVKLRRHRLLASDDADQTTEDTS